MAGHRTQRHHHQSFLGWERSLEAAGINDPGGEFGGGFFWNGGGAQVHTGETGYSSPAFNSSYVGWQMVCGRTSCPSDGSVLWVYQVQLQATENAGPQMVATGPFWYATGWMRGRWPLAFVTSDPSGTCNVRAVVAEQIVQGSTSPLDQTRWHQCPNLAFCSGSTRRRIRTGPSRWRCRR